MAHIQAHCADEKLVSDEVLYSELLSTIKCVHTRLCPRRNTTVKAPLNVRRLAAETRDEHEREMLLGMARQWDRLAEHKARLETKGGRLSEN